MTANYLAQPPRYLFFTGKGGVGKTSLACATAVQLADCGKSVLLVSTDPAANVGQVFGINIGNHLTHITAVPGLTALEIDPQAAAQAYRDRLVAPVRGLLPESAIKQIEEQLSGACTTEIAAFDEFTAFLTDTALTSGYDHIVFDTAPTGHTIRLLQLPGAWHNFLAAGKGDASCLGPLAGLEKHRSQYQLAVAVLADTTQSRLILVSRAQQAALREVARTHAELAIIGLTRPHLIINGMLPAAAVAQDSLAAAIFQREQAAISAMPTVLKQLPCDLYELKPYNLVGVKALKQLLTPGIPLTTHPAIKPAVMAMPKLAVLIDELAADGRGLIMVMGKGGVGKTTLAAAIAVALAQRGLSVQLSTSDPAAHLNETLCGSVDKLTVSRIDPHAETARYRQQVLESKGKEFDEPGRALLEEDLRSPCTEEIAVFQAFARIIAAAEQSFVVMDTAPTGHTLLLLDATGAYHREVSRQIQPHNNHAQTPLMQLQDPKQTKVLVTTLAETTPVLEAAQLQDDLRRAGIQPWAWIINQAIAAVPTSAPLLQQRAANEVSEIETIAQRYAARYAVVPLMAAEPVGITDLMKLAGN